MTNVTDTKKQISHGYWHYGLSSGKLVFHLQIYSAR